MANEQATPKKFAMQQVFEILLRKPSDKSIYGYLTDCKTTSLENTVEMVWNGAPVYSNIYSKFF